MSTLYKITKNGIRVRVMDMSVYPKNWNAIREEVKKRAGYKCEECGAEHRKRCPDTKKMIYLQCSHNDHDTTHNVFSNLRALCPRCHFKYDAGYHIQQKIKNKEKILIESGQQSF